MTETARKPAPAPNRPEPDILNAHRYMLPFPEMAGALAMTMSCVQSGDVEVYRNKRTGGLMMGYVCPDCETHHPLIEIHTLPGDCVLNDGDRMIMQTMGCPEYRVMLEVSDNLLHACEDPHVESRDLIRNLGYRFEEEGPSETEQVFHNLPMVVSALMEGVAMIALDRKSGLTALGVPCGGEECDAAHGVFLLAMPRFKDMRQAAGYEFLGNPFLDMLLEVKGAHRH